MIMDKCREAFEKAYSAEFPNSKVQLLPNGRYSGWIKQNRWESWQSRQAEINEKDKRIGELERALKLKTRHSDFYENSRKAHRALSRYRKQKIDELQKHSISLREAAKSWIYTEREKNILISQADDIDRILGGNNA